ncbi:MAG: (2Fe-2S)-binding protein, partial [Candidatus Delongbacteria bacterium]|nr:(2Fe-2S)-binding protein [Candidatus Delongbacteria bacterium]MCG2760411.1 2Fe-2S iron-sulfur cluster-binding protein [Candidatus Delongbacteria bacterium]
MKRINGEVNVVKLTIDDKIVEVEEGSTLLDACQKIGIKIPTLCHHKALSPYGACRLCLVEIFRNDWSYLQVTCNYPAQNGMVIKTDTDRVLKTRKIIIELLLARCPNSEVLQILAKEIGVGKPRIELKNEDCILCGLCVRMCKDRMGKGAIGFANRGNKRVVVPAFEVMTDVCQTCGACVSVCPTKTGIKLEKISENKPIPILSEFNEGL